MKSAALDQRVGAEHLGDRLAECLRAIEHGEDAVLETQATIDEIGEQILHDNGVLGVTQA